MYYAIFFLKLNWYLLQEFFFLIYGISDFLSVFLQEFDFPFAEILSLRVVSLHEVAGSVIDQNTLVIIESSFS